MPPVGDGRYHRRHGVRTWYGSRTERGAWAEFFRHWVDAGVSPFEVRRRVGRVRVSLVVLDLTRPRSIAALGLLPEYLVADDLSICQDLADQALSAGFEAILAPSAALPGEVTLAVFDAAIMKITVELDRGVRRAPPRMVGLRSRIRWLEAGVAASVNQLWTTATVGRRRRS